MIHFVDLGFIGQVSASSQVSEVKDLVHTLMSIPACDQKLLYRGKALAGQ